MQGNKRGREASGVAHESSGVEDKEGDCKASGVTENLQGYRQGVVGGVQLPQGTGTPGVSKLPQGDKNPGVTTVGEGVPGGDGPGRGGDVNSPTTRLTKARGASAGAKERVSGSRTPPPRPQWGTAADNDSVGTLIRHTASTDSARAKHGMPARRKYGLLEPIGTVVNPDEAGDQGSGDGHKSTREKDAQAWMDTEEGGETWQRALPARGMQGFDDKGRRPPKRSRALNACGCQGGERGEGPSTHQRAPTLHSQGPRGTLRHGNARP